MKRQLADRRTLVRLELLTKSNYFFGMNQLKWRKDKMIRKKLRLPFVFLLAFVMALALASCDAGSTSEEVATGAPDATQEEAAAGEETAAESEEAAAPEDEQPLIVLLDNDEGPITPANFNTFIGYWLVGYVYDSLFARAPDLSIVPALATEATPSEDGLTWNVKLRDDVTWHDGQPFTAEDVIFSFDFLKAAGRAPNLSGRRHHGGPR